MIDWEEIATTEQVRRLARKQAEANAELQEQINILLGLVERLGDELNQHNDNYDAHVIPCNVILYEFTLPGQRGYDAATEEATNG